MSEGARAKMTERRSDVANETLPPGALTLAPAKMALVYFDDAVRSCVLRSGMRYRIGRSPTSEIVLRHPSVSRDHAIIYGDSPPRIEDLGSRNGTRVGGRLLAPGEVVPIDVGTTIEVGGVAMFLQGYEASESGRPESGAPLPAPTAMPPESFTELNVVASLSPGGGGSRDTELVLTDPRVQQLYRMAEVVAQSDLPVLIHGETGVGKERLAQSIHQFSPRAHRRLVTLNCAAIPETILESELFGYERGAFTGAVKTKMGLVAAAEGGTLFLDEVGELALSTQAKLLRVLEAREFMPLGSLKTVRVDVRFIAATNHDLRQRVTRGSFREDLYYRLSGVTLEIPPLRDRPDDILELATRFAQRFADRLGRVTPGFSTGAIAALREYKWPGNVRELKNVVERAVLLTTGELVESDVIATHANAAASTVAVANYAPPATGFEETPTSVDMTVTSTRLARPSRDRIMAALGQVGGNQAEAAKLLGVSRRTLIKWLDEADVPRPRKKRPNEG